MASSDKEYKLQSSEDGNELLISYLMGSSFHHYLRNTYPHFHLLLDEQKNLLVRNAELFRVKQDHTTMQINYNQPTLSIIIYGELRIRAKTLTKGYYFYTQLEKTQIHFLKKTLLLMLNKAQLEKLMDQYELFYTKKQIIQRILPTDVLGFEKKSYKILCQYAQNIVNSTQPPYSLAHQNEPGLYLLYEGTYALISSKGTKIAELVLDLHGEECLWGQTPQYKVKPITFQHKYLWLHKSVLLQVLNAEALAKLKENHIKIQQIRREMENRWQFNLQNSKDLVRGCSSKRKKKFSNQQMQQFNQILGRMSRRGYRPKWMQEEQPIKAENLEKMKKKRQYMPQKAKPKYFSTMEDKPFDLDFYQTLHQIQTTPYHLKLHLHERSSTQLLFHRRARTEHNTHEKSLQSRERQMRKTSHSYYSFNYDRSYTTGMTNLAKMKQYQQMKHSSTLKRGQKFLSTQQLSDALKISFGELHSTIACSKRERNMDPLQFLQKSQKKNKLLVKKLMDSKGLATWR